MKDYTFICDVDKTLLLPSEGKDPYNEILQGVLDGMFPRISINDMGISGDGKPFVRYVAEVIEKAFHQSERTGDFDSYWTAQYVIDKFLRGELMRYFFNHPAVPTPGLEKFLAALPKGRHGILTGNLEGVSRVLMTANTFGDLSPWFPEKFRTCGDDPGVFDRVSQILSTYAKLGRPSDKVAFVDDSANGIWAMRTFINSRIIKNPVVIGVLTGSSNYDELKTAGAHIVLSNVGYIPDVLK